MDVLRIGHRPDRDKRITTHVALAARAFGADSIHVDTLDEKLTRTVMSVVDQFGGDFSIDTGISYRSMIRHHKGCIVHLTMYGMPLDDVLGEIPQDEDLLVVVGSEKVPRDVFDMANFNISISDQPHSEVSALAIFLDRIAGPTRSERFHGAKMRILPSRREKKVISDRMKKESESLPVHTVPDEKECMAILEHVGCSAIVFKHVLEVHSLGMDVLKAAEKEDPSVGGRFDIPLVRAGLLLHDIGRARTHSIGHVTEGVKIAYELGLDPRLAGIIHNHVGAGLTAEEARNLGLPFEDHIPLTPEEKFVCHIDSLIDNRRRITLEDAVEDLRSKGALKGAERMSRLHEELEMFLGLDLDAFLK